MIHDRMQLHNVSEIEPACGGGLALLRVPRAVADALGPRGCWVAKQAASSEIRFVTDAATSHLTIGILGNGPADVLVYRGDLRENHHIVPPGTVFRIELHAPASKGLRLDALRRRYDPQVWRIVFENVTAVLHGLETHGRTARPPMPAELPRVRWLAHGSSITHGSTATRQVNNWVNQCAWRLGWDAINLGMGGSCRLEPEMSAFIAGRDDWEIATLELGVNVRVEFEPERFERMATAFVHRITDAHPAKPVALITTFTNRDHLTEQPTPAGISQDAFDEILRRLAATRPNLHLIEGRELLADAGGLTWDLIHPADHGMQQIGERLAPRLAALLPKA